MQGQSRHPDGGFRAASYCVPARQFPANRGHMSSFLIAIDFDGTCVDHRYPEVGPDVPGAAQWLRRFTALGARLILWTMRSGGQDAENDPLADAVTWFAAHGIALYGINQNPDQASWTASPKVYAHKYIDDAAACCPLRPNPRMGGRPYVDWSIVGPAVVAEIEARSTTHLKATQ
jgi:hypothetical protein